MTTELFKPTHAPLPRLARGRGRPAPRAAGRSRLAALVPVAVLAAELAGCGSDTQQVVSFVPERVVAMGEESSVLDDSDNLHNARKYLVNGIDTTAGARNCVLLPSMPQMVASHYGLVFAECNPNGVQVRARNLAVAGARVDDGQSSSMASQVAAANLGPTDLVTIWFGANDLIDIYRLWAKGTLSRSEANAEAERRGTRAAELVNQVLSTGARALVFTAPDMGLSPYARARTTSSDPADAAVPANADATVILSELSLNFNGYLRTRIDARRFDGRNFGLVFADEAVQAIRNTPTGYPLYLTEPYNVTDAGCVTALPNCTNAVDANNVVVDLVTGGTYSSHLWASDRWLGYPGHYLLGVQAISRLNALPF